LVLGDGVAVRIADREQARRRNGLVGVLGEARRRHDRRRYCCNAGIKRRTRSAIPRAPAYAVERTHLQSVSDCSSDEWHLAELRCRNVDDGACCLLHPIDIKSTPFPYTTLFRSLVLGDGVAVRIADREQARRRNALVGV